LQAASRATIPNNITRPGIVKRVSRKEIKAMQLGMIGLGRMGANMVRRLMRDGQDCVVYDVDPAAVRQLADEGATAALSPEELTAQLTTPRAIWMMVPVARVDATIETFAPLLEPGDILIDGGNTRYHEDIRRAKELAPSGIHCVDVGTSGGVWGLERGYCLMIGGETDIVRHLDPIFASLSPAIDSVPATPGHDSGRAPGSTAEHGYLHCGPHGAGHFVKMVHNGIEYALMAAYAEGMNILRHADEGQRAREADAETTPLENPEHYQYDFPIADIAELWRRGSVIGSWLLDLTASALARDPELDKFAGQVADSGEGRWTVQAAVDEGVPAHVLTAALYTRFSSRERAEFANKMLSAMRFEFGGHEEK
jgi:6-phosphogluconate dehydrogenase